MPKSLIMRLRHIMMVAPPAEPGGDGQQQGDEPPAGEKTFSQSDVNRIVEDRLRREQAKYADYDDLKAKARNSMSRRKRTRANCRRPPKPTASSNHSWRSRSTPALSPTPASSTASPPNSPTS